MRDEITDHRTDSKLTNAQNQRIALFPFNSTTFVYSGSAVIDTNNTSGFFSNQDNGVVALYTIAAVDGFQTQNVAFSKDGGYTFETYANNPILIIQSENFRDPQVTWHATTKKWVMAVSHASVFAIEFYVRRATLLQFGKQLADFWLDFE